ncbi:MAG: shikimate kinase [Spirochaetota bacterium]
MDKQSDVILLTGMKHCGKTTLGKRLASLLNYRFIDMDELIESEYLANEGLRASCRQIYRNHGEAFFRYLEVKAAGNLAARIHSGELKRAIVALGGGTVSNTAALNVLKNTGFFVYLEEDAEVLYKRILEGGLPPFLATEDPWGDFMAVYNDRCRLFEKITDTTVKLEGRNVEESLQLLVPVLKNLVKG